MLHPAPNNSLAAREMPALRLLEAEPLSEIGSRPQITVTFALLP